MKPTPALPAERPGIPETLNCYLRTSSEVSTTSTSTYLEKGAALVTNDALLALRNMLPSLRKKIAAIKDSHRLQQRLEILTLYFEETFAHPAASQPARRDIAFALLYFLKGYDRIPDSIPEIGLLDDAIIVNIALQWHIGALREHWLKHGRTWSEEP